VSAAKASSSLRRRPCTLAGFSSGLAMQPGEALKHLDTLCRSGAVTVVHRHNGLFYKAIEKIYRSRYCMLSGENEVRMM